MKKRVAPLHRHFLPAFLRRGGWIGAITRKFLIWGAALSARHRVDATIGVPTGARLLERRNTAHPDCFAARTAQGWGVVDRAGVWRIPDLYAEIGEVRHVTIDYESIVITLNNEDRWVAAVRQETGGLWGGVKLEMRSGEEVSEFVFESAADMFNCIAVRLAPMWRRPN